MYCRVTRSAPFFDEHHESDERERDKADKVQAEDRKVWPPEGLGPEAKHGQDGGRRDFDVDAVLRWSQDSVSRQRMQRDGYLNRDLYLVILELQIADFVDQEAFEGSMEEGDRLQPPYSQRHLVTVHQQTRKQQAVQAIPRGSGLIQDTVTYQTACTHLNSITRLPTKLATPELLMTMLMKKTTLLAARLNMMRTRMNFQNSATVGTRPTGL